MVKEMLEVLDPQGEKTGGVKPRDEVHERELLHPVSNVWIYNKHEELLMQKRSENKAQMAGCWGASAAGHIIAEEKPRNEAVREVREELGINVDKTDLEYIGAYKNEIPVPGTDQFDNEYAYTFLLEYNGKASDFELNDYEVEKVGFFPLNELYSDFTSRSPERKYVPYGEYFKTVIDKVKERLGYRNRQRIPQEQKT